MTDNTIVEFPPQESAPRPLERAPGASLRVSSLKEAEQWIGRLVRMTKMQSGIHAAVLRIRERDDLLQEACRIATEVGGYDRAVLSLVEADGKFARPTYRSGLGEDFPEPIVLEVAERSEFDTSLSSRALRTGQIAFCDLSHLTTPVLMRERLLTLGYKSLVALPLIVEGRRVGVLLLASREMNILREDELTVLEGMTATLVFALRSQQNAHAAEYLAYYDPLTGLPKRQLFCERLNELLYKPCYPEGGLVVAVVDIRGLTHINDSLGRHFGDRLLQKVAERLRGRLPHDERIGYLGGGSFAIAEYDDDPDRGGITGVLDSCVFDGPFVIEDRSLRLSYRSGIAYSPADGTEGCGLLDRAEAALRHAKESGERSMHYRLDLHSEAAQRLELEHRLRSAIEQQQFELYYQPQLDARTGKIESVEALLRWNSPDEATVCLPGRFLPILESSGLIITVGRWVLEQAARSCEHWSREGLPPVRVAVNVSPLQLAQKNFVDHAISVLRRFELGDGFGVDLEITETALLQDLERTSAKLRQLRAAGYRVALDDFGTGYSSLGLLSKLPVDLLKIDRSFVCGLPADLASATLAESIIRLARGFGLLTVAEGVETAAQLRMLQEMKCDYWQGYLCSEPLRLNDIERLLRRGRDMA